MTQNQREVIGIDPDNAELRVIGVVSGHVLQDFQELVAICGRQNRETLAHLQVLKKSKEMHKKL